MNVYRPKISLRTFLKTKVKYLKNLNKLAVLWIFPKLNEFPMFKC